MLWTEKSVCLSLLYNSQAEPGHVSQPLCASVYPSVINHLYLVGSMSFVQWGGRRREGSRIEMKSFFFLISVHGQNVNSSLFLKLSRQRNSSEPMLAGPGTSLNRKDWRGSILVPSQIVLTGGCSSRPGLLGCPGRQMEMIWAHPVWPEFDPLGKIRKRKEREEGRQTDSLKNYAYWKLDI